MLEKIHFKTHVHHKYVTPFTPKSLISWQKSWKEIKCGTLTLKYFIHILIQLPLSNVLFHNLMDTFEQCIILIRCCRIQYCDLFCTFIAELHFKLFCQLFILCVLDKGVMFLYLWVTERFKFFLAKYNSLTQLIKCKQILSSNLLKVFCFITET